MANQKRLLRTLEQLTNRLKRTLAKQPLSSFHVSSEMIVADPKSLESKKPSLFCRPGSVLKGRMCGEWDRIERRVHPPKLLTFYLLTYFYNSITCILLRYFCESFIFTSKSLVACAVVAVQCPVGTYFSLEHNECESCWLGSFQDQEGQLECKSCPEGSSTAYLHSRSIAECKGKIHSHSQTSASLKDREHLQIT